MGATTAIWHQLTSITGLRTPFYIIMAINKQEGKHQRCKKEGNFALDSNMSSTCLETRHTLHTSDSTGHTTSQRKCQVWIFTLCFFSYALGFTSIYNQSLSQPTQLCHWKATHLHTTKLDMQSEDKTLNEYGGIGHWSIKGRTP